MGAEKEKDVMGVEGKVVVVMEGVITTEVGKEKAVVGVAVVFVVVVVEASAIGADSVRLGLPEFTNEIVEEMGELSFFGVSAIVSSVFSVPFDFVLGMSSSLNRRFFVLGGGDSTPSAGPFTGTLGVKLSNPTLPPASVSCRSSARDLLSN